MLTAIKRYFFLAAFFVFGSSLLAFSWESAFLEKVYKNERPEWMIKQIKKDLEPFLKTGISPSRLDQIMSQYESLVRLTIKDRTILIQGQEMGGNWKCVLNALVQLMQLVSMPDVDFIICFNDACNCVEELTSCTGPLFSFSKKSQDEGVILMPDYLALCGNILEMQDLRSGNLLYPWDKKESKAFWRGANTGFPPGTLAPMDLNNFHLFPRTKLVELSKKFSELLDAGFNSFPQSSLEVNDKLYELGYVKDSTWIRDHLKYKYQILIDGYGCAWQRSYWQFFSNCVIFKQTSPEMQWFYADLKPYIHFIPINYDMSDLIEKIQWAQQNDEKVQEIVKNANQFADSHLLHEDIMLYLYLLLTEYSKLF